ncbi:TonB-dependent receptor plug domain-containing protein [Niveispirillum sp. SYP-B3756]|uniref:TonB-dependent receptor n=1 Tax=Niveispirillum sp. SYP-B3756 TaxID=2662178 RepID=UPI001291C347|nr:TonB-dependent receptor [Niveispirillum sp. SYP-B3756]MQP65071.1 TonB-dependent receptor plug domain-containing protein [Niveispirillum sp. SYP-B3756]
MSTRLFSPRCLTAMSLVLALTGTAGAQQATSTATQVADMARVGEEIVVTARRSAEKAVEVPFAVSVISGQDITEARLHNLSETLLSVPGVDINASGGPNDYNVRIRGVGSLYKVSADDNSVVLNIDGVALSTAFLSLGTLDIERVEVLKGPQGTLFGRNSEAGAINVITAKPKQNTEGYVRGEIGQEGHRLGEAAVGGAISDQLSARIAVRYNEADNWVDNARDGKPLTSISDLAGRFSLVWDNGNGTDALLTVEGQRAKGYLNMILLRPYGDHPALDLKPGAFDENKRTAGRYSAEINHDFSFARLTSVTAATTSDYVGWKAYDTVTYQAMYGMPNVEYLVRDSSKETGLSQELRLASLPDSRLFWVAGLLGTHGDLSFDTRSPLVGQQYFRDFTSKSIGVFAEATYPLTNALKLTGGIRQSHESKDYKARYINSFTGTTTPDKRDLSDNYTTGRLALSYELAKDTNLYTTLARGYKSGGISYMATNVSDSQPYKAASVNSLEIGFKTAPVGGNFSLNGAVFVNQIKDDHILKYDSTTFAMSVVNADVRSIGAELEGSWRITKGLVLNAGLSRVNSEIRDNVLGLTAGDIRAGNKVPDVPGWSANGSLAYEGKVSDAGLAGQPTLLNARVGYRWVDSRPADAQNNFDLDAYGEVDARIGLSSGGSEFYLWSSNLFDSKHDVYGYGELAFSDFRIHQLGAPARGRVIGVGASHSF